MRKNRLEMFKKKKYYLKACEYNKLSKKFEKKP